MNRKAVSMASIFLVLILGLVVTPATACSYKTNKTSWSIGSFAMAYFSSPVDPTMLLRVEAMDYKASSVGPYEALLLSTWYGPIKDYIPLAAVTDNEETAALMEAMFTGIPSWLGAQLVEDDDLEVWRKGRKVFASLTAELDPLEPPMPSYIEFEVYGWIEFQRITIQLPTTYTMRLWYIRFDATAQIGKPWNLPAYEAFVAVISFLTITGPAI